MGAAEHWPSAALKVDRLMDQAFFPGRSPRSREYRAGCRAGLEFRLCGAAIPAPYAAGTAAADAFFAGAAEGHSIWRTISRNNSHCITTGGEHEC